MRQLILLRGAAGCGKSTWIKENDLEAFTLCPDQVRLMIQTPIQTLEGNFQISQKNDSTVWKIIFDLLEKRMERGELTIIDATHSRVDLISRYKKLCDEYRYRLFVVDFTKIPADEIKRRNSLRPEYKRVPESAIDMMLARFESQPTPNYCQVIKPEEYHSIMKWKSQDFSKYEKIIHIGDIHGCYEPLKKYFDEFPMRDENLYCFIGDYIDRGIQNAEVINFLLNIYEKENVVLLEGNHERWLWLWSTNRNDNIKSKEFLYKTLPKLEESNIDKTEVRKLYRRLQQVLIYNFSQENGRQYTVIVNHAGISAPVDNVIYMPLHSFIHGVGNYGDDIDNYWLKNVGDKQIIQIRGHRNTLNSPIQPNEKSFCLEGKVEFGKDLRIVELTRNGFITHEIQNTIYDQNLKDKFNKKHKIIQAESMKPENALSILRSTRSVIEKKLSDRISSFNFSRNTFYDKDWNSITIRARGLFVDTTDGQIISRSYNKFFNIGELDSVNIESLRKTFVPPITGYIKENGYLGLLSVDPKTEEFFFASKSTNKGDFANWFKTIFEGMNLDLGLIKNYLLKSKSTMVFEVIDPINDPHIISYKDKSIILLDVIKNTYEYNKIDYDELVELSERIGIKSKQRGIILFTFDDFENYVNRMEKYEYKFNDKTIIEGMVFEDQNGAMVKKKCDYYFFWKDMRKLKETIAGGKIVQLSRLYTDKHNYFYGWVKNKDREFLKNTDIISLRKLFEKDGGFNK